MVLRHRPRGGLARPARGGGGRPRPARPSTRPSRRPSSARSTRSAPIDDPHRAIDWLSTFPQVVLLALGRAAVRFQDAARDGRAVVYAGIQADPLVARAADAARRRDAGQRVLARAVMNGMTTDADGWRTMFPTLFGPARAGAADRARSRGGPRAAARGRRPRRAGPQPVPRRDRRGADRAPPRPVGRGADGRPPRAAHPVRRRARRDPPVRRHGRARRRGRGVRLQVGRARDQRRRPAPARRRARRTPPTRTARSPWPRRLRRRRSCAVRLDRQTAPHDGTESSRSSSSTGWPPPAGERPMTVDGATRPTGRCSAAYRVRFDEAGPDGLLRTSSAAALRPGPGLVPFGGARLRPGLVRGTWARLAGARGRGRGRATDPGR